MSNVRHALMALAEAALSVLPATKVERVVIADPRPSPDRDAEFGLIGLTGEAAGLYYAWLGEGQADLPARYREAGLLGRPALDLARLVLADDDAGRSIGIAAVNAVTSRLYQQAGYLPPQAGDSMAGLVLERGMRLGMVGNFPSLVRRALAAGVEVRVVERKSHMLREAPGLLITDDPEVLRACPHVICTGATLINDSFDAMLPYCSHAQSFALIGPTVGCFPDPLFERGVTVVAGTRIVDAQGAAARLAAGAGVGELAVRTRITRDTYPGFERLIAMAQERCLP